MANKLEIQTHHDTDEPFYALNLNKLDIPPKNAPPNLSRDDRI